MNFHKQIFLRRAIPGLPILFGMALSVFLLFSGCPSPKDAGKLKQNQPPETSIANVPPPDSLYAYSTPRLTLYWSGKDKDGFVTGFRFRWLTHQPDGDTVTGWRTILNLSYKGLINRSIVPEVWESPTSAKMAVPKIYHYLSTLTGNSVDSVVNILDSGKALYLEGDSVFMANKKEFQNPNKGTFIFDSRGDTNHHTFEIKAVDNLGEATPTPATVRFGTPRIYPPDVRIEMIGNIRLIRDANNLPPPGVTWYTNRENHRRYNIAVNMLPEFTETYKGLYLKFTGSDSLSSELEYQWKVDSKPWSDFTTESDVYINASMCDSRFGDDDVWYDTTAYLDTTKYHTIIIRTKNQYQLLDDTPDTLRFKIRVPNFRRTSNRYLFIDNTDTVPRNISARENPGRGERVAFFYNALQQALPGATIDTMVVLHKDNFPNFLTLTDYNAVVLSSEKKLRGGQLRGLFIVDKSVSALNEYLNLGGKLIISSWDLYSRLVSLGADSAKRLFFQRNLHFPIDTIVKERDFVGANGIFGYPSVTVTTDTSKVLGSALDSIIVGERAIPFGEVIYNYRSLSNTRTSPVGVRYIGPTYKIVYFGFPLFYIEQPTGTEAAAILRKAFQDIQELP
ncbi:MAG: hypothetical protein KGZ58_12965 [Ignavibacteriales bacterium]|nr:hypothetical protein [Ignavibacteriales bacterium]